MITRLEIIVAHEMRDKFEAVFDFIHNSSDTATAYNLVEMWEITYLKEDDDFPVLTDEVSVTNDDDLELLFSELLDTHIDATIDEIRLKEGDLIVTFNFGFPWRSIEEKIRDYFSDISYHHDERFLVNFSNNINDNANSYVFEVYSNALLVNKYSFDEQKMIVSCTDLEQAIELTAKQYLISNEATRFTEKQVRVILKKIMKITMNSTERGILQQTREKISKAEEIIKEAQNELFEGLTYKKNEERFCGICNKSHSIMYEYDDYLLTTRGQFEAKYNKEYFCEKCWNKYGKEEYSPRLLD
ncbi:MAG: hypothetical protein ACTSYA_01805 [Candidatus Kariarchaeaceae archaeon]